ncbi:hypothetical protein FB451DRAFT_1364395 [Mycena latifolia]|nr:hypothetical protein FB451DRAFT_1364395 [Mycena latifolia]
MTSNDHSSFARLSDLHVRYIFQFLEDAELYDFSLTSLRLHKLALSLLLFRRHIPNPLDKVDVELGDDSNTLQVLRIALFVRSIRKLSIWFSPGVSQWAIWPPYAALTIEQLQSTAERLAGEMLRLRSLLNKLDSVDEITLILPGSLEWNLRDVNLERGSTSDIFSWSPVLSILQEILGKQCTSFNLEATPFWSNAPVLAHPGKATDKIRRYHPLRKLLKHADGPDSSALARWDGTKYRPQKLADHATNPTGTRITTFTIQSTLLFFPALAGWTFSVLKHSPLVSLHISGLNISQSDWDQIARRLAAAVPNLLELNLDDKEISPNCLMRLLCHLPRLTSLALGQTMTMYLIYPRIFPPFSSWYLPAFRSLTKLSAHACYVSAFLMRRNPLPALACLPLPPTSLYNITALHHNTLYIQIPEILRSLRDANHPLFPLPVTITFPGYDTVFWLSRHIDASLALDPKILSSLREITHLVLEDFYSLMDTQCLARWLRLFPSLRKLSWQDARVDTADLACEILRACPILETIEARNVQYRLPSVVTPTKNQSWPSTILKLCDLPTEILLLIFDFLHTELFSLSLLCRRLHFLALPIFLARNSIDNPCEVTTLDMGTMMDSELVLRAVRVSLFVPSIKHLACIFPNPFHIYQHLDSIRRVTSLVKKLMKVEHLSLVFAYNTYRLHITQEGYDDYRIRDGCFCALNDLLCAIQNKSCTSLSISGSPAITPSIHFIPERRMNPPSANITSISNLFLDVDRSLSHYSTSSWILTALKSSPITSLHVIASNGTRLKDLERFSSALTVLSFDGDGWGVEILNFVARCRQIKTLSLGSNFSRPDDPANAQSEGPVLHFDGLVDLTAPVSYIRHFIPTLDRFPALERLRILLAYPEDVDWNLTALIEAVREHYPSSPAISLDIINPLDTVSLASSVNSMSFLGGKWMHAAHHITGLGVWSHSDWFRPAEAGLVDPDVFPLLVNWFSLFKGLSSIRIGGLGHLPWNSLLGLGESVGHALPNVQIVEWDDHILFKR